jgi:Txe/YoeB family toxin of Txe-Axe toxin-antitoxin module
MEVAYSIQAQEDLAHWKKTNSVAILKKIAGINRIDF